MRYSGVVSDMALLADEVESLTSARKGAASGNEPSDSLRVCRDTIMSTIGCALTNPWRLGGECTFDGVG